MITTPNATLPWIHVWRLFNLNTGLEHRTEVLIKVENLKKYFPVRKRFVDTFLSREKLFVHAIDGISFKIRKGDIMCLAGESGSGKTTTGRLLTLLERPTDGKILFKGKDVTHLKRKELKVFRKDVQIIFQNPYESIDPRNNVFTLISEPLAIHNLGSSRDERFELVYKALEDVELKPPETFLYRRPHELSGGQRQRVAIARALSIRPELIIADEPVSMLDVSICAGVMNLLLKLKDKLGLSALFITHDLSVGRYMSNRLAIMYLGRIMEIGSTEEIIQKPQHPYTQLLLSAIPIPDPTYKRKRVETFYEIPSSIHLPKGCRFHPRCQNAKDICKKKEPELQEFANDWSVACYLE